jgi:cobalamin biosynthesis protein CbiG
MLIKWFTVCESITALSRNNIAQEPVLGPADPHTRRHHGLGRRTCRHLAQIIEIADVARTGAVFVATTLWDN